MREAQYTRQERLIIGWLRFSTGLYFVATVTLTFIPERVFGYLNDLGLTFFDFVSSPFLESGFDIGWAYTVTLMACSTYCAFRAQRAWLRQWHLTWIVIFNQGLAAVAILYLVCTQPSQFYFWVLGSLHALLGILTGFYYVQATQSRTN